MPANNPQTKGKDRPERLLSAELVKAVEKRFLAEPNLVKLPKGSKVEVNGRIEELDYSIMKDENGKLYALYNKLGKGAFGTVKLTQQLDTNQWYAVKIQVPDLHQQDLAEFEDNLKNEEKAMHTFDMLIGKQARKAEHKFYTFQILLNGMELGKYLRKIAFPNEVAAESTQNTQASVRSNNNSLPPQRKSGGNDSDGGRSDEEPEEGGSVVFNDDDSVVGSRMDNGGEGDEGLMAKLERERNAGIEMTTYDEPKITVEGIQILFSLFKNTAHALDHIHRNGYLHLDIKPANIFVDSQLNTVLFDFGISLKLPANQAAMKVEQILGTPGYMSPEMGAANYKESLISTKADVYSLGIAFKEMLEHMLLCKLQVPFNFANPQGLANIEVLNQFAKLISQMCDLEPEKRPSAHEIASQLTALQTKFTNSFVQNITSAGHTAKESLALLQQFKDAPVSRQEAITLLRQQGKLRHRQILQNVSTILPEANSNSTAKNDFPLPPVGPNKNAINEIADKIKADEEDPTLYLKNHPGEIFHALELLRKKQGHLNKQEALRFAGECQKKGILKDYRSAVQVINQKYK